MKRVLLLMAATALVDAGMSAADDRRPNILILYADDMGYGDLSIQNPDAKIATPHLDQLARQGTRFNDAHSSSGICSPSRYALLTGRFHWRKFHAIVNSFEPSVFDAGEPTLPGMLKQNGYRTACIGKWHLGWNWDAIKKPGAKANPTTGYPADAFYWSERIPGGPIDNGFDYYFGDDVPNFPPYPWFENDRVLAAPDASLLTANLPTKPAEGNWETRPGPMVTGWDFHAVMPKLTEKAVEWIGKQRGQRQPFFLYVPFTSPHAPIVPASEFAGKSEAGGYGDYVMQTDASVGRILQELERQGFARNTLVIFTADNGPERYAYDRIHNFQHRSTGQLRGVKRDLWEGGHREPFIVRWPGQVRAGAVSNALISQVDLFATIAAATGSKLPPGAAEDSYDLTPVWKAGAPSPRRTIVHNTNVDHYAVRHDNWLLVAAKSGAITRVPPWFNQEYGYRPNDRPGELYDLAHDLAQRNNLHAAQPEKVAELEALLKEVRLRGQVR